MSHEKTRSEPPLPKGLAQPALRALARAEIGNLTDLSRVSENELKSMHGIGPKAVEQLRQALIAIGLSYRE